jgi:hypothetical protein
LERLIEVVEVLLVDHQPATEGEDLKRWRPDRNPARGPTSDETPAGDQPVVEVDHLVVDQPSLLSSDWDSGQGRSDRKVPG